LNAGKGKKWQRKGKMLERNLKANNITVKRLHCPFPRNILSVIEEQTK
jgi:hypothetical protein